MKIEDLKFKILCFIPKWFYLSWYRYLFAKRSSYYGDVGWVTTIICRIRNHPAGVVYYNSYVLEPDMHCRNCGDDLG